MGNYKGNFNNGKFHGVGTYSWSNGAKYVGDHDLDQRTGFGTMVYPDGAEFSGIWANGVHKEFRESRDSLPTTTTARTSTAVTTTPPPTTTTEAVEETTMKRRRRKKNKGKTRCTRWKEKTKKAKEAAKVDKE